MGARPTQDLLDRCYATLRKHGLEPLTKQIIK
jgi:hypothetical protein